MSIELEKLGPGSIVKTYDGELYMKSATTGTWHHLAEATHMVNNLRDLYTGELIHEVGRKGPLDDFVKGDVISFEGWGGVRIAARHRIDFWTLTGSKFEWTTEELEEVITDKDSVKKVGSIDG